MQLGLGEVERLHAKLRQEGFQALTVQEKEVLMILADEILSEDLLLGLDGFDKLGYQMVHQD